MIDIFKPKHIKIINKDIYCYLFKKDILTFSNIHKINIDIEDTINTLKSSVGSVGEKDKTSGKKEYIKILRTIYSSLNLPNSIIINNKVHVFSNKKKYIHWKIFEASKFHDDYNINMYKSGILIIINCSEDYNENISINDNDQEINPGNSIIKLVEKNEIVKINSSYSENEVKLIWFIIGYNPTN